MSTATSNDEVRAKVREHYGKIAENFAPQAERSGCGCSTSAAPNDVNTQLYTTPLDDLPTEVTELSLGSGDPITLANLQPGESVLDLGSGGGIDCFLAAKQVGETGHIIGVDMTPQMIEQARANQTRIGAANVEFRLGEIEHLPIADSTVDVVISNCVINLAPDKTQVLREAFRALKPGGRLAISDIITDKPLPPAIRSSLSAWAGCVGGALDVESYRAALEAAGFEDITLDLTPFETNWLEAEIEEAGLTAQTNDGQHVIIGTGDGLVAIEIGDVDRDEVPQGFSGKVQARKPLNA